MNDWTIGHDENPAPETELIHYADQTAPAQIYRAAFFHEDSAEIPTVLETGRSKRPPGRLFLFPHPRLRTPPGSTNEVREMMRHHGIDTRSGVVPDDCKAVPLAMTGSPQVQIVHAEPRDATGVFIPDEPTDPGQLDAMLRELGTHLNGGDNGVLRWFHAESCPDCRSYRWRLHSESTRLNLSDFRESVEPARPSMLDAACSVAAAAGHNPSRASRRWFTSKTFLHTVEGRRTRSARTVYETTDKKPEVRIVIANRDNANRPTLGGPNVRVVDVAPPYGERERLEAIKEAQNKADDGILYGLLNVSDGGPDLAGCSLTYTPPVAADERLQAVVNVIPQGSTLRGPTYDIAKAALDRGRLRTHHGRRGAVRADVECRQKCDRCRARSWLRIGRGPTSYDVDYPGDLRAILRSTQGCAPEAAQTGGKYDNKRWRDTANWQLVNDAPDPRDSGGRRHPADAIGRAPWAARARACN